MFLVLLFFFFFKQKTAYEMRISDWSSDVCSSDLIAEHVEASMNLGRITGMDGLYFGVSRALPLIAALERSAICLTIAAAMRSESASLRRILETVAPSVSAAIDRKSTRLNYSH